MTPLVTIITPTFNRPQMFSECAASVLAQTFTDWTWWVVFNRETWDYTYDRELHEIWNDPRYVPIWYPVPESGRGRFHIPSQIVNWLYPKVQTPYIYWLSDDDLIDPHGMEVLVDAISYQGLVCGTISGQSKHEAVYGCCQVVDQIVDGSYQHGSWCYPGDPISTPPGEGWDVGGETGVDPHCRLDGGQVLHTKALWDKATADGWQQTDDLAGAAAQDGLLLRRLAQFARFHFVPTKIVTHRRHAGATFHKPQTQ